MDARVKGIPIPPRIPRVQWVERVKPGAKYHVVILSEAIWGLEAHWSGSRTIPCTGTPEECPGCVARNPKRWRGGVHVYDLARKESYFVELTPGAARKLMAVASDSMPVRGLQIDIYRSGSAVNGRLMLDVVKRLNDVKKLPAEQDPGPVLRWLWQH